MIRCTAHRGYSGDYPENTLLSIKKALACENVDTIEVDVQKTKDGTLILMHDYTLERTTDGFGTVRDKTYKELLNLHAGRGEKVPTLEEALLLCKGKAKLNIELKAKKGYYEGYEKDVVALVEKHQMENEVLITSFNHEMIYNLSLLNKPIKTGLIVKEKSEDLFEKLKNANCSYVSIKHTALTDDFVKRAKKENMEIIAWTIDDVKEMKNALILSKEIHICTNFPLRALKLETK